MTRIKHATQVSWGTRRSVQPFPDILPTRNGRREARFDTNNHQQNFAGHEGQQTLVRRTASTTLNPINFRAGRRSSSPGRKLHESHPMPPQNSPSSLKFSNQRFSSTTRTSAVGKIRYTAKTDQQGVRVGFNGRESKRLAMHNSLTSLATKRANGNMQDRSHYLCSWQQWHPRGTVYLLSCDYCCYSTAGRPTDSWM